MHILHGLYSSDLKKVIKVVRCCIICNLTTKPMQMQLFKFVMELKLNWLSYASDVTCQLLDHGNATKSVIRIATTSRRGKALLFKPKTLSFYTTDFSYITIFPKKIDKIFGFWVGQSLKVSRNTCFRGFKSSLAVNSHVEKPGRLVLSKMWTLTFCFSKDVHMTTTSGQSA